MKANVEYGLRPELADDFKAYLQEIISFPITSY